MTRFSSGKHEHLSVDPEPWRFAVTEVKIRFGDTRKVCHAPGYGFNPRPKFDTALVNPANPILGLVREGMDSNRAESPPARLAEWLAEVETVADLEPANPARSSTFDQVTHARRVLERLAAITGRESA